MLLFKGQNGALCVDFRIRFAVKRGFFFEIGMEVAEFWCKLLKSKRYEQS